MPRVVPPRSSKRRQRTEEKLSSDETRETLPLGLRRNLGKRSVNIKLMASSDAGSSEDDVRSEDRVTVCEPNEIVELELSCCETFSIAKDYAERLLESTSTPLVDMDPVHARQRKRKGRVKSRRPKRSPDETFLMHSAFDDIVNDDWRKPDSWPLDPRECRQLRKLRKKFPPVAIAVGDTVHRSTSNRFPQEAGEESCMADSSGLGEELQEDLRHLTSEESEEGVTAKDRSTWVHPFDDMRNEMQLHGAYTTEGQRLMPSSLKHHARKNKAYRNYCKATAESADESEMDSKGEQLSMLTDLNTSFAEPEESLFASEQTAGQALEEETSCALQHEPATAPGEERQKKQVRFLLPPTSPPGTGVSLETEVRVRKYTRSRNKKNRTNNTKVLWDMTSDEGVPQGPEDIAHRSTSDQSLTATESHPLPLSESDEPDMVKSLEDIPVMRDGWPETTSRGIQIPRVLDPERREDPNRAEKLYGRDAIGFPTKRRVRDGYRKDLSDASDQEVDEWLIGRHPELIGKSEMSDDQRNRCARLLYTWKDLFTNSVVDMPATDLVRHAIPTRPGAKAKIANMPLYTEEERLYMRKMLPALMAAGVIAPCRSTWSTKTKFVRKRTGKLRMVQQFMQLNNATIKDAYPMARIEPILNAIGQAKMKTFFQCDAANGYWAVPLDLQDAWKTAFPTDQGQVCYLRMGQGLCGSPRTYSLLKMTACGPIPAPHPEPALWDVSDDVAFRYFMDDDVGGATSVDILFQFLHEHYFPRLKWAKLTLNPDKCKFFSPQIEVLGFIKDEYGIRPSQDKQDVIGNYETPEDEKDLERFCAMLPYIGDACIPGRADLVQILKKAVVRQTAMELVDGKRKRVTKKLGFVWTKECDEAFKQVKHSVLSNCVSGGDPDLQYHLATDASGTGIGGHLFQLPGYPTGTWASDVPESGRVSVKFMSFQLTEAQRRYHTTEREFLAVITCLEKARHLVNGQGQPVKLYTDHTAVKDILRNSDTATGRIARWQQRLGEFDHEIMHIPGKQMAVADGLSRMRHFPYVLRDKIDLPTLVSCATEDAPGVEQQTMTEESTQQRWKPFLDDPWYSDIVAYKLSGRVSEKFTGHFRKAAEKRIGRQALRFVLIDGEEPALSFLERDGSHARCILKTAVPETLYALHETCGHWSYDIAIKKAHGQCYWPTRNRDIRIHCRTCHNCQLLGPLRPSQGLMPVMQLQPMDMLGMDFLGPISPRGPNGERYIIILVDYATRYCWMFPMVSSEGAPLKQLLEKEVFSIWGYPRVIYCDNASQFKGGVFNAHMKKKGVKVIHPPAGSPWSVGLAENYVKLMKKGLQARLQDQFVSISSWPEMVATVCHNIRTRHMRILGFSAAQLMFGFNPRWGEDLPNLEDQFRGSQQSMQVQQTGDSELQKIREYETRLLKLDEIRELGQQQMWNTQNARVDSKERVWKPPETGDLVLLRRYALDTQRSRKLEPRWVGPYLLSSMSENQRSGKLRTLHGDKEIGRHHINNMKLYVPREEAVMQDETWMEKTKRGITIDKTWKKVKDDWQPSDHELDPVEPTDNPNDPNRMVPVDVDHSHFNLILHTTEEPTHPEDVTFWMRRAWTLRRMHETLPLPGWSLDNEL